MTQIAKVKTATASYQIFLKKDVSTYLKKQKLGKKYAIITDSKVKRLYAIKLKAALRRNNIQAEIFSFKDGEKSKTMQTVESLANELIEKSIDRQDAIIALGGGVVGDIAGFLASIYMRGIPYIQVPTTLLAMVDSSIGGKTGVDLESGKNLLGTFAQPHAVLINPIYLHTLPVKQVRNGLAEVIKYGVISDSALFKYIEKNLEDIIALKEPHISHIIKKSAGIKAKIVTEDEKESGIRMILNYGHTYGHAIERLSNYRLLHGHAISIGMVIANKIAVKDGILKKEDADKIKKLLKSAKLPITTLRKPSNKDLLSDKKKQGDYINFIFPTKIGATIIKKIKCQ